MPKQAMKYFLFCRDKLVLDDSTEEHVQKKITELLGHKDHANEPAVEAKDFKLVVGRKISLEIDTGVRVKLTKRVHQKNGKKKAASAAPESTASV